MLTKNSKLATVLKLGKPCRMCNSCCSYGTGFLVGDDAKNIAKFLKISEKELKEKYLEERTVFNTILLRPKTEKKPYGRCVFLTENGCSIHKVKPLQCKIGNCSSEELSLWFMLNYQLNTKDPQSLREFAVYLDCNGKTLKGGQLADLCEKKKLKKILSYEELR